jgi:hypothetical protein
MAVEPQREVRSILVPYDRADARNQQHDQGEERMQDTGLQTTTDSKANESLGHVHASFWQHLEWCRRFKPDRGTGHR